MALTATFKSTVDSTTGATSYTTSTAFTPTANTILLAFISVTQDTTAVPGVTGNGLTWEFIKGVDISTSGRVEVWAAKTGASPSNGTQTMGTWGSNRSGGHMDIVEVGGITALGTLAAANIIAANAITGSGTGTSGSISLSAATDSNNRPFSVWLHTANEATTPRTNWTELGDGNHGSPSAGTECQWRSDTFETTASASWAGNVTWVGIAFEFAISAAQTVSPGLISSTGSTFSPSVTQSVAPGLISSTGSTFSPAVTQSVTPGLISQTGATFSPTINQAAGNPQPPLIDQTGVTFSPSVTQQVVVGLISSTGSTFTPQVNESVSVGLISSTGSTFSPQVNQSVVIPQIDRTGATFSPSVKQAATLGLISNVGQVFAPVVIGGQFVTVGFINQAGQAFAPQINEQVVVGLISNPPATFDPAITQAVSAPLIVSTGSTFDPAVTSGLTVQVALIDRTGAVLAIQVINGPVIDYHWRTGSPEAVWTVGKPMGEQATDPPEPVYTAKT